MDIRIPPLKIKKMLESNPLKSTMLVGRLGVVQEGKDKYLRKYLRKVV